MFVKVHGSFAALVFVSFLIGTVTYLLGCNPQYKDQCVAYNWVTGTAYDYSFKTETCRKCAKRSGRSCKKHTYFTCYTAYVKFHYGNNATCLYQTDDGSKSPDKAQQSVAAYPVGSTKTMIKMKGGDECDDLSSGMVSWGVGIAFFTIGGLAVLAWVAFALVEWDLNTNNGAYFGRFVPSSSFNSFSDGTYFRAGRGNAPMSAQGGETEMN